MKTATEIVALGLAWPAITALLLVWALRRWLPAVGRQHGPALAAASAFWFAFVAQTGIVAPNRHWHWLPYVGLAAALIGSWASGPPALSLRRWLPQAAVAVVAAYGLVPAWPDLVLPRAWSQALVAIGVLVLSELLQRLEFRSSGTRTPVLALLLAALALAASVTAAVSETYGRLALALAAALAGAAAGGGWRADGAAPLAPLYAALVGGLAYVVCIEPQPPLPGLLVIAAAPAVPIVLHLGPLGRLGSRSAAVASATLVILTIAVAMVWIVVSG
jgi:hypothetical protein